MPTPSQNLFIGVDIGGTKVAAGLVNSAGEILKQSRVPMIATGAAAAGLACVSAAIDQLLPDHSNSAYPIGVCAPGPLNPQTGVIINPPNLPAWHNFPLAAEMRRAHHVSVHIDNDANAAALAETIWGAGRGFKNVFYATLGTGIGTGIIQDGRIYHGRTGAAGEGGHMGIDPRGPLCNCGKRGCIEIFASGTGIGRRARQLALDTPASLLNQFSNGDPQKISSHTLIAAFQAHDPAAVALLNETLDLIAYWLGNIIDLLEPDVIVLGGGVSSMLAPFLEEIRRRWLGACLNPAPLDTPLVLARYGEDAGIAGAAALCSI